MMPTGARAARRLLADAYDIRRADSSSAIPLTGQPFPGNIIPADRADARGLALLNLLPMPNTTGVGLQLRRPGSQHPASPAAASACGSTIGRRTKTACRSKGRRGSPTASAINVAGASARWGLVRQRYDFTADQLKVDYTRIINTTTMLEAGVGKFYSTELGPPEDETALAGIQRTSYPALAGLPQFASVHNPLNLIPQRAVRHPPEQRQRRPAQHHLRQPLADHRAPIPRWSDSCRPHAYARRAHVQGRLRPRARALHARRVRRHLRRRVQLPERRRQSLNNAGFAFANAYSDMSRATPSRWAAVPDNRWQTTWAWYVQDTWKPTRKVTVRRRSAHVQVGPPVSATGEASAFTFERFDPDWGGKPPVLFQPVTTPQGRRARNPLTGEIVPVAVHRPDGAGHRLSPAASSRRRRRARSTAS